MGAQRNVRSPEVTQVQLMAPSCGLFGPLSDCDAGYASLRAHFATTRRPWTLELPRRPQASVEPSTFGETVALTVASLRMNGRTRFR
jgi:hypothetical protein